MKNFKDFMNYSLFKNYKNLSDLKNLSKNELLEFCEDLRSFIVETISKTGGHLGASLGVIELTVALHYVFNSPTDKIIWDVGHQSYPHKVLTGRKNLLHTVRKEGGISGFTNIFESKHDVFGAGHSSTSISAGLGISAVSKQNFVLPVIGDGAMSAGLAFEALNNAEGTAGKMIIILNDNDMSISPPTGAISNYLPRLANSSKVFEIKSLSKEILPEMALNFAKKLEHKIKRSVAGENIFEGFGLGYYGPIEGHDILKLVQVLEYLKENASEGKPILLHVKTEKGKGYEHAENADDKFHGVAPFCLKTGEQAKKASEESFSLVASRTLCEIAKHDEKVYAITPAMKAGSALENFALQFPERFFDVGIAEQHAVTFAGGMATERVKPYCFIYSTFLQRAYDQVIHDVALQNLPVRFIIDRAGIVGEDGATHNGVFDISFLRILPNMVICSPSSKEELEKAMQFSASFEGGPFAIRFPRGSANRDFTPASNFEFGKGRIVKEGSKRAVIGVGITVKYALEWEDAEVIDLRFIKPIDEELILKTFKKHKEVILLEDGSVGGVYSIILEVLHKHNISTNGFKAYTLPDKFIEHGKILDIHKKYSISL